MKLLATSALALCLLVTVGCADSSAPTTDTAAAIENASNKVQANISGMDCTGCSGSVTAAVTGIDGVTACYVDLASGDVSVALADDADAEMKMDEIKTAITELSDGKFTVNTITAGTEEMAKDKEMMDDAKDTQVPSAEELGDAAKDAMDSVKKEVDNAVKEIEVPSFGE